ncbi:hypothetical protein BV372_21390 [Nostoc sp. T09]|uniref:LmeA family phospholipid-binding protein n=1 Tax=Nostoc sp. T09 TaxID=1932621 RepID=UPI000A39900B|nr:DUF2993 domain-containing protein [Nostoc sp. T09]OUL30675.1 hypothetical protein BV372_21390 [Nostoc sp. T09]
MPEQNSDSKRTHKIRIITNMLTTALKLWLRAQVSQVAQIEVEIRASDRQLLSGKVPWVSIFASHAVYQGLHIGQIQLVAENIQVNIGSVIKGQPLRLLETVPVVGELIVEEKDLNHSLSSELLSGALNDVLVKLLPEQCAKTKSIAWQKIILENNQIILSGILTSEGKPTPVEICTGLDLISGHELQLAPLQIKYNMGTLAQSNHEYNFNLGSDVDIQELTLIPGKLMCRGRINVIP